MLKRSQDSYRGPVSLLKEAYEETESFTAALATKELVTGSDGDSLEHVVVNLWLIELNLYLTMDQLIYSSFSCIYGKQKLWMKLI